MDKQLTRELWQMIEPVLEPEEIELVELEFQFEAGKWVLRLYIDSAKGITLDNCQNVSRQVGALFDIKDPIDKAYTLEVSSPGVNRVLRKEADFKRFAGSPVRIKTRSKISGRRNFVGVLKGAENDAIIVDVEGDLVQIDANEIDKARLDLPESDLFREDLRRGSAGAGD